MKRILAILFLISDLCFSIFFCYSQQGNQDSLVRLLSIAKEDTSKVNLLNQLASNLSRSDGEKALKYAQEAIALGNKTNFRKGLAVSYKQLGIIYTIKGDYVLAEQNYSQSLKIYKESGNNSGEGRIYINIGIIYKNQGNYKTALENYHKALSILEKITDREGIAQAYTNIGNIHNFQGNYKAALDFLFKALKILEELNKKEEIANSYTNIASVSRAQQSFDDAKKYYKKSHDIYIELKNKKGIADADNNLGTIYYDEAKFYNINNKYDTAIIFYKRALALYEAQKSKPKIALVNYNLGDAFNNKKLYDSAIIHFNRSLQIREELKDKNGKAFCFSGIGEYYYKTGNYTKAAENLLKSVKLAEETGNISVQKDAYDLLSLSYEKLKQFDKAYYAHVKFKTLNDSIFKDDNKRNLTRKTLEYEFEQTQKEQQLRFNADMERQRLITTFSFVGLGLVIVLAFFIFQAYRIKKRANHNLQILNAEILQQKEEITAQRDEIEAQRDEIEAKSKEIEIQRDLALSQRDEIERQKREITDSIHYARRIQNAILPAKEMFVSLVPDFFLLFKPRDIVSGDFYWMTQKGRYSVIAAADCTGHGVPGAFMSLLGVAFLNEIVNKNDHLKANEILDLLRESIIKSLHQTGKADEAKDGMDISLCIIEMDTLTMQFAGAYNPLYIIRKNDPSISIIEENQFITAEPADEFTLYEIKADRMPIGIYLKGLVSFQNIEVKLIKGDTLYLFSDGYVDQFGGAQGRKLRVLPFKQLLVNNQDKSMLEQKQILEDYLIKWQGERPQLDDILVIGLRL